MLVANGNDTLVNLLQSRSALSPMLVADGKDTLVNALQELNALSPMLVANGNDMLVKALQELNASRPMLVTISLSALLIAPDNSFNVLLASDLNLAVYVASPATGTICGVHSVNSPHSSASLALGLYTGVCPAYTGVSPYAVLFDCSTVAGE